jgi:thiamine biosynthesis lipoprotein
VITLYSAESVDTAQVFHDVFTRLREIEGRMSASLPDTDIARVNAGSGAESAPVPVHPEVFSVLERALYYADLSGGAFDPTVGPLVKLWGIGTDAARLPAAAELNAALPLVNWREVVLDAATGAVRLSKTGMALDLGAIAKGYAADEAARVIAAAGVAGAIIDLGGNICVYGVKNTAAPETPWRVGIQNPQDARGAYLGVLAVEGGALGAATSVVTSGVYERYVEIDGTSYHHILSTTDGMPVDNGLLSVTITAASSMDADALSTTVFALGYEAGRALIESRAGVEALFVFADKILRATSGFLDHFTLSDTRFQIAP